MREYQENSSAVLQMERPQHNDADYSPASNLTFGAPRNHLLAALRPEEWERIFPFLQSCVLEPGQPLFEAGEPIERVYFPHSGLVSFLVGERKAGDAFFVDTGLGGCETAVVDISVLTGGAAFVRNIVQVGGEGCWMPAPEFREEYRRGGVMQAGVLGSLGLLTAQSAQSALCNKLHTTEERLSRWLLLAHDRIGDDEIEIRQKFLAYMLGTRSSGVAVALGVLQQAGLILHSPERVTLLDRPALENCACECYSIIAREYRVYEGMMSRLHELSH